MTPIHTRGGLTTEKDFQRAERLQYVQPFEEKYICPDFTKGFSQNGTAITYFYNVSR
jgi:hypothetical protein